MKYLYCLAALLLNLPALTAQDALNVTLVGQNDPGDGRASGSWS